MLDAADWERANKEFKIPQPSIIGRILCCPTPPSKLKDGAYFEEPEKVTTDCSWLVFLLIFMGAAIAAVLLVRTMYTLNHMNVLVAGVRKKREKTVRATFSAPSANAKLIRSEV